MLFKLTTLFFIMVVRCHHVTCSDTFDWKPYWMADRNDLKCQTYCNTEYGNNEEQSYDKRALPKCCVCRSSTTWENTLEDMYIEFTTVLGGSAAVYIEPVLPTTYYRILHTDSVMSSLPKNLCDLTYLMELDFSDNHITSLGGIECAYNLDRLDLSNNEIEIVKNTTFAMLKNLRIVDLSNNRITYVEPNVFTSINVRFFRLDLSSNNLTTVDVTNILGLYPYCVVDYKHNAITELVNENGFTMDLTTSYGPGYIDLKHTSIQTIPDYKTLFLLDDLNIIGKLFEFGIDIGKSPIICDCRMETFLELAKDIIETVWVDHHNITCTGPKKYYGTKVVDVPLNELVCHLGVEDGCPVECSCIDEPNKGTITIECVNAYLTEFPDKLPVSKFSNKIDLNLANNSITEISSHLDYLHRINHLNVGNNDLTAITEEVAALLENATSITLTGNDRLNHLPQQFQSMSPCDLQLDGVVIKCDCNMSWLQNWLSTKTCDNNSVFYCFVDGEGLIDVRDFRKDMLECFSDYEKLIKDLVIGLSIALFVIIMTSTITVMFRYELLVIYVRFITQYLLGKRDVAGTAGIEHHAVFSFDECNEHLRNWVLNLRRYLAKNGYNVFVPEVDIVLGARDEETIKEMNKSACVIVVLSESYANGQDPEDDTESLQRNWFENEWKYAWNKFCSRPSKRLIFVNYDHLVPGEVSNHRMKAYLRVGKVIDFTNTNRDIMTTIERNLGDCSLPSVNTRHHQSRPRLDLTRLAYFNKWSNVPVSENNEKWKCSTKFPGWSSNDESEDRAIANDQVFHDKVCLNDQCRESKGKTKIRKSQVAPILTLPIIKPGTLFGKEHRPSLTKIFQVQNMDKTYGN